MNKQKEIVILNFTSKRVNNIPPYIFSQINIKKKELKNKGIDIIDLGMGDPDLDTPQPIVNKLIREMATPKNFKYSSYSGCLEFRESVSSFYKKQYNVDLNPHTEILTLIGSKEGISNLIPTLVDPGKYVLIPDPSYGVYRTATLLANGKPYSMPITKENNYKPELEKIPEDVKKSTKLMFLNYPSNPTATVVDLPFFQNTINFAKRNKIPIAHDFAYNMISFVDPAPSILQAKGAKDIAVEFGSLSKSYNMTGWRLGYVVGNEKIIKSLATVKSNTDTSQFLPIQKAGAYALKMDQSIVNKNIEIYKKRMKLVVNGLKSLGIKVTPSEGSFFVWFSIPANYSAVSFTNKVLEECGVVITPGSAFGISGEGYARISLTHSIAILEEALKRLEKIL